ncbi:hypothetical protein ACSNOI_30810 [Actinomadura kijaniata]|uniref:hypothetical protein n=1 Tax=Actinomadura kijaniata TaxID=46161 RepID=UPI003F1D82DB
MTKVKLVAVHIAAFFAVASALIACVGMASEIGLLGYGCLLISLLASGALFYRPNGKSIFRGVLTYVITGMVALLVLGLLGGAGSGEFGFAATLAMLAGATVAARARSPR